MTTDPQSDRSHRTVLAVTVTSRADGGHYFNQADFTAHVAQWLRADLKGHHAIAEVTVSGQAAAPVAAPPAGQTGLRELIAEALIAWTYRGKDPEHGGILETVRANAYSRADAVLSVLRGPIPAGTDTATWTAVRAIQLMNEAGRERDAIRERAAELAGQPVAVDRGAVLREAADLAEDVAIKRHGQHEIEREQGALDVMIELRRLAAAPQPDTHAAPCGRLASMPSFCSAGDHCCVGPQVEQPAVVAEPGKECAASVSGNCLAEAQSETGCATEDGECIHAGQPGKEA